MAEPRPQASHSISSKYGYRRPFYRAPARFERRDDGLPDHRPRRLAEAWYRGHPSHSGSAPRASKALTAAIWAVRTTSPASRRCGPPASRALMSTRWSSAACSPGISPISRRPAANARSRVRRFAGPCHRCRRRLAERPRRKTVEVMLVMVSAPLAAVCILRGDGRRRWRNGLGRKRWRWMRAVAAAPLAAVCILARRWPPGVAAGGRTVSRSAARTLVSSWAPRWRAENAMAQPISALQLNAGDTGSSAALSGALSTAGGRA